ncbi:predicted protein [Coccidioides posadasii str. Silveira]|uniref:Predicted protein n=1 Tax=Coccidioides posadasii (strain RMSCC 757 / Silveira) TaxID=443226 RepID=E9DBR7_COCPS|nr:predicted protein [Coccidioides posadasii str. Silveira]
MNCECPLNRVSNRDDEVVSMDKAANNLLQNSFSLKVLELTISLGGKPSWVAMICCNRKRPGKPGSHDPELKKQHCVSQVLKTINKISAGHGSRQRKTKRQNALIHAVIDESLVRKESLHPNSADATLVELAIVNASRVADIWLYQESAEYLRRHLQNAAMTTTLCTAVWKRNPYIYLKISSDLTSYQSRFYPGIIPP